MKRTVDELKLVSQSVVELKRLVLDNKNLDILLYLAKYNPDVNKRTIEDKFGKEAIKGMTELRKFGLIQETKSGYSLTLEGVLQVDGMLSAV